MTYQKTTGPLMANSHPGSYCGQDAYADMLITERERDRNGMGDDNREEYGDHQEQVSCSEESGLQGSSDSVHYVARRLVPTECAVLQGFPQDWCADVPHSDSAEYKLWGNGIALPCLLPMMKAMSDVLRNESMEDILNA